MLWNRSHSEAKPFSGGSAEMARQAVRNAAEDTGMRWISPPSRSMFNVPAATWMAPAPKNSTLLNSMWLKA